MDNGPEFISKALDRWANENGVQLDFSRPGKPTDNAFVESFNGRLRYECLNAHWFLSLADARAKFEAWRSLYNESRSHTALSWLTLLRRPSGSLNEARMLPFRLEENQGVRSLSLCGRCLRPGSPKLSGGARRSGIARIVMDE